MMSSGNLGLELGGGRAKASRLFCYDSSGEAEMAS